MEKCLISFQGNTVDLSKVLMFTHCPAKGNLFGGNEEHYELFIGSNRMVHISDPPLIRKITEYIKEHSIFVEEEEDSNGSDNFIIHSLSGKTIDIRRIQKIHLIRNPDFSIAHIRVEEVIGGKSSSLLVAYKPDIEKLFSYWEYTLDEFRDSNRYIEKPKHLDTNTEEQKETISNCDNSSTSSTQPLTVTTINNKRFNLSDIQEAIATSDDDGNVMQFNVCIQEGEEFSRGVVAGKDQVIKVLEFLGYPPDTKIPDNSVVIHIEELSEDSDYEYSLWNSIQIQTALDNLCITGDSAEEIILIDVCSIFTHYGEGTEEISSFTIEFRVGREVSYAAVSDPDEMENIKVLLGKGVLCPKGEAIGGNTIRVGVSKKAVLLYVLENRSKGGLF